MIATLEPTIRRDDERGCAAYRRFMELLCKGFTWEDARVLAAAPVPLACIAQIFTPA